MLAVAIISWTSSSVAVQALQRAVPDFQLSALRYLGCLSVSILWIAIQKPSMNLQKVQYAYIIAMSIASTLFNVCYFAAVSILPLTNASGLTVTLRMIFFALMTSIRYQVSLDKILIVSIVGCTAGMIFITQPWSEFIDGFAPGFFFNNTEETIQLNVSMFNQTCAEPVSTSDNDRVFQTVLLGYLLSILAAVADSIYMVVVSVHLKSVNPAVMCFASASICVIMSILISFYVEQPILISDPLDILLVSAHLLATGISLVTETAALQLLNPVMVSIIENVDSITYIIPQYTFMGRYLHGRKNVLEVFGCILIAIFAGLSSIPSCGDYHEDFIEV